MSVKQVPRLFGRLGTFLFTGQKVFPDQSCWIFVIQMGTFVIGNPCFVK